MKLKHTLSMVLLAMASVFRSGAREECHNAASAVGTHSNGVVDRLCETAAITTRYVLVQAGTSKPTQFIVNTAITKPMGVVMDEPAVGESAAIQLLGSYPGTMKMIASGAITADAPVYTDADGKVTATAVAGCYMVGRALNTVTTDGDTVEVQHCHPVGPYQPTNKTTVAGGVLAIPTTHRVVEKTTGGAEALTLANGVFLGQRLNIFLATDGGDGTLTPTTKTGFTTIVFADKGDVVDLEWTASGWAIVGSAGIAAPPVTTLT